MIEGFVGTFQKDLRLFRQLRNQHACDVRIETRTHHSLREARTLRILEVMEERIEVLCELFAQRLDPFGIPGDVYASAAQGFEGSVFELTNRLRAQ